MSYGLVNLPKERTILDRTQQSSNKMTLLQQKSIVCRDTVAQYEVVLSAVFTIDSSRVCNDYECGGGYLFLSVIIISISFFIQ